MHAQQVVWVHKEVAEVQPFRLRLPRRNEVLVESRVSQLSLERTFEPPQTGLSSGLVEWADDWNTCLRLLASKRRKLDRLRVPRFAARNATHAYDELAKNDLKTHAIILSWGQRSLALSSRPGLFAI